ncbi:fibrous sheath CABYR-binding protein-like [Cajanus cajan]|uniref:fibrous sheath CABYR-binding protein-like n=1 Tax=Cajanus cajan TaxID=3821 RepID=UPI0010FB72C3|nr:fibrous sheath CABYR-binding protein-like [Cajanus cajan]
MGKAQSVFRSFLEVNAILRSYRLTASDTAAIDNLTALPRPLDCKLVLSLANSAYKERGLESIMGKNKWRELKHRYNVAEIEVPEPQEEEISPLKVNQKRKRGEKEVGGTSAPRGTEEVTSKAADADAVDLTGSPPPGEAPQMVAAVTAERVAPSAEAGIAAEVEAPVAEQVAQAAVAGDAAEVQVPPRSEVPGVDPPIAEQGMPVSASVEARGKGPSLEVSTATPAPSAAPSGSSQGAS